MILSDRIVTRDAPLDDILTLYRRETVGAAPNDRCGGTEGGLSPYRMILDIEGEMCGRAVPP